MTEKKTVEHSEETKKKRRKIEEKLRRELTEDQVDGLAKLLQIDTIIQDSEQKS
jgi:hypothetical protein